MVQSIESFFGFFPGAASVAARPTETADPATAGSGVGVLGHPGVRKLGVVKSIALEE